MTHHALSVPASVTAILALGATGLSFVFNDADTIIANHRERQQQLVDEQQQIMAAADEASRDLSTEETTELDRLSAEYERIEGQIQARERALEQAAALRAPAPRAADPDDGGEPGDPAPAIRNAAPPAPAANAPRRPAAQPRQATPTNWGFRNFGDFARVVRNSALGQGTDQRLIRNAAASTYGSESVGADGGFAVPPDYRSEIMERVFGEYSLAGLCDRINTAGNQVTFPSDMTTPWDSSGGIQAYWTGEGAAITQSKPSFEDVTVRAHKLAVLVPVTEELNEDAPALDGYLRRKVPEKIDFKLSNAIVRGNGVGQPLGFTNSPCVISVAKESSQTADTIVAGNVLKMWGRLPLSSRPTAVWLIHPDAEQQLPQMTIGDQPIYMPPGGLIGNQYGMLLGRPVIPHQVCNTVGDQGDIYLADLRQYVAVSKTGGGRDANGMRTDVSMHLWFDQDLLAYKTTIRFGGQPWWSAAISPRDGSSTMSPFIELDART